MHAFLATSKMCCIKTYRYGNIPLNMPIIQSAKKKMRKDKKLTGHNAKVKTNIKNLVKAMRKTPTQDNLSKVSSALDKASKTHYIHKNKASRLKSRLSKYLAV